MDYTYNTWLTNHVLWKTWDFVKSCQQFHNIGVYLGYDNNFSREFPPPLLKNAGPVWQLARFRFLPPLFQFSVIYHFVLKQSEIDGLSSSTIPTNQPTYILTYITLRCWIWKVLIFLFVFYSEWITKTVLILNYINRTFEYVTNKMECHIHFFSNTLQSCKVYLEKWRIGNIVLCLLFIYNWNNRTLLGWQNYTLKSAQRRVTYCTLRSSIFIQTND